MTFSLKFGMRDKIWVSDQTCNFGTGATERRAASRGSLFCRTNIPGRRWEKVGAAEGIVVSLNVCQTWHARFGLLFSAGQLLNHGYARQYFISQRKFKENWRVFRGKLGILEKKLKNFRNKLRNLRKTQGFR